MPRILPGAAQSASRAAALVPGPLAAHRHRRSNGNCYGSDPVRITLPARRGSARRARRGNRNRRPRCPTRATGASPTLRRAQQEGR